MVAILVNIAKIISIAIYAYFLLSHLCYHHSAVFSILDKVVCVWCECLLL